MVFSHQPQFPLSGVLDPDLISISPDVQQFVKMCSKQIQTVRAQVHENVRQSQLKMVSPYSLGVQSCSYKVEIMYFFPLNLLALDKS